MKVAALLLRPSAPTQAVYIRLVFPSFVQKIWKKSEKMETKDLCRECNLLVKQADPALECDVCMRWYHLNCNTGKCLLCVIDFLKIIYMYSHVIFVSTY